MTGEILRLGHSASESLLKLASSGSAAIRKTAKEESEGGPIFSNLPRLKLNPLVSSSYNGRSQSAGVMFHKPRNLPSLKNNSDVSLPRQVQSAPTKSCSASILSPIKFTSLADAVHPMQRQKSELTSGAEARRRHMSFIINEADETESNDV
jgi:hypothetical protein